MSAPATMKISATTHALPRSAEAECADACAARVDRDTAVAVLADGAGAARAGAEAARRITESIITNFAARPREWDATRALREFARIINQTLFQESLSRFDAPELVSTLACVAIEGNRLSGINVGDSRVYLLRDGHLEQLSVDHVDTEQAHVLQRAIGLGTTVTPHYFQRDVRDGDLILLCSDGVTNAVAQDWLRNELARRVSARTLIQFAQQNATSDELDDLSAAVLNVTRVGRMRAASQLPLLIPTTLRKGDVIDGYEFVRPFASSDRVWLAAKDGRRWTLKFAPVEAASDDAILEAFAREMWNAARIEGQTFVEAFVPDDATARYYVQEFVEAPSLKTLLRSRPLGVDEAIALGEFLCEAEAHLLRLDLVHGDLKPDNILAVSGYDRVRFKLVDLGSCAEIFTVTSRAGTASYLAPERFHGAPISERTEIFSVGVTLYEALTRKFPFGEIERYQTPAFHWAKPASRLNPNVPPWLDQVLLRALSIEPERRYQHFSELAFDLAHPERVEPFYQPGTSLIDRNPLAFYRAGFWVLLITTLYLVVRLLTHS